MTLTLTYAPIVWLLHFVAVYGLVSLACPAGLPGLVAPGVAIATAAAIVFYGTFGAAHYRRSRAESEAAAFVGRVNAMVSALSAVGTLWVAYPAFVLPPCAAS